MSIQGKMLKLCFDKGYSYQSRAAILHSIATLSDCERIDCATLKATEILMADIPEEESVRRILHEIAKL